MRIVVIGATGNVGTSTVKALAADPAVTSVLGVSRRTPDWTVPNVEWWPADIKTTELAPLFRDAAAVVHLGWAFQPTHDSAATWRTNVLGSVRVFDAVAEANVSYAREKAYVERVLDVFEARHHQCRVVRLRPGFIFKQGAAQEQRRIFAAPLVPHLDASRLPVIPDVPGLRFQALATDDAAEAYRLAVLGQARGAFNLAADPVIGTGELAGLLGARLVRLPVPRVRTGLAVAWHLNLVPASPGLFDAVLRLPIMALTQAHDELGWTPRHSSLDALRAFLTGLRDANGLPTRPLAARAQSRLSEFRTGRRAN